MSTKAFALREDRKDSFSDAGVSLGGGRVLAIGQRLREGDGVIVTDDPREQQILAGHRALKQVEVPAKSSKKSTTKAGPAGGKE